MGCGMSVSINEFEEDKYAVSVPNSTNEIILMFKYAMVLLVF